MVAMDRGQRIGRLMVALATVGACGVTAPAVAHQARGQKAAMARPPAAAQAQPQPGEPKTRLPQADTPRFAEDKIPVNPTDPIAVVNNEVITRQELANECVIRKGPEILETLVARRLIEQELRRRKLEVTASEIDQEIEDVAQRMAGIGREAWLRTLDKERNISPAQYARDIIYPGIALRKLASGRVQVTEGDIKEGMEANFGPRLTCRIIMTDTQRKAIEMWEELKKNPGAFEKIARERSTDTSTRALGGLLPEPIARYASPREVSKAAFEQLVDGDPRDSNPAHKPKDGDITGPIQVTETAFLLFKRERLDPARAHNPNDPALRATLHAQVFNIKLEEKIKEVFGELMDAASIDNRLTGTVKLANEERYPEYQAGKDRDVKLMGGDPSSTAPGRANTGTADAKAPSGRPAAKALRTPAPPAGVPSEVVNQAERVKQTVGQPAPR